MRPLDRVVEFARNLPDNVGAGLDIEASSSEVADLVKALNQASTTLDLQYMALECSQAITDGILRMSMDGIITMDRNGRLMSANDATSVLLGYSLKNDPDSIPALWDMMVDPAQGAALRREVEGGERDAGVFISQRVECSMRHRDGTVVPIEISVTCVDANRADLYAANLRNIEEQQVFAVGHANIAPNDGFLLWCEACVVRYYRRQIQNCGGAFHNFRFLRETER